MSSLTEWHGSELTKRDQGQRVQWTSCKSKAGRFIAYTCLLEGIRRYMQDAQPNEKESSGASVQPSGQPTLHATQLRRINGPCPKVWQAGFFRGTVRSNLTG